MIDYDVLKDRNSIWIALSGGVDSAALLFLIVNYLYDNKCTTQITPWCIVDSTRPGNQIDAQRIVDAITDIIPYPYINQMKVNWITKQPGGNKAELTKPHWLQMRDSRNYDLYCSALSSGPSIEEMKQNVNFYNAFIEQTTVNEDRNPDVVKQEIIKDDVVKTIWYPFINKDKKFIAKIYDQYNLMDSIFPITKSCVDRNHTPCMKCFWCYEKNWAFGMYDMEGGPVVSSFQ